MDTFFQKFQTTTEYKYLQKHPIVYFCAEYALADNLPLYAGGLGILAGDMVREASDQNLPFIAVGLFYHEGYVSHNLYGTGVKIKQAERLDPEQAGLLPVHTNTNERLIVSFPIQDTEVYAQVWKKEIGHVTIYLLDTDIEQNDSESRRITNNLYAASKEVRFKQEIVLGFGGLRVLHALGIAPSGFHLNEGHSALLALEIARLQMLKHKTSFQEELEHAKKHITFTNHTLVVAGNDVYNADLASVLLSGFAKEVQVPVAEILKLGLVADSSIFSMTLLALRMAGKANAVSKLHAEKAKEVWHDHPMQPITNGIHLATWDKIQDEHNLWQSHQENKRQLLSMIHKITGDTWDVDTLLLGWARRVVGYKRPLAIFDDLQAFKRMAENSDRPVRLVISGLSHASDQEGVSLLDRIHHVVSQELKGLVVYLPEYTMPLAKELVAGCDVWLNTPVVGFEACGTSGMKAALNGTLPVSTNDGWIAEVDLKNKGWLLDSDRVSEDLINKLQNEIIPLYYERSEQQIPQTWVTMMQNARNLVQSQCSATEMLKRYTEEFYIPFTTIHKDQNEQL